MGAEESVPLPSPPPGSEYMVIGLSKWRFDKVIAMYARERELSLIREAICQHWGQGIESEKAKLNHAWSFKFNGFPFIKSVTPVQFGLARRVMCQMLQNLNNAGWQLKITSDLSRTGDLTTFYFQRSDEIPRTIREPIICIGLRNTDKLQLINMPDHLIDIIKKCIADTWSEGIQSEGKKEDFYEIKLSGNPWNAYGYENVEARFLIAAIFTSLAQQNWKFHASVNMMDTTDSLFFKYDPESPPLPGQRLVISFNEGDKLRLMNAPQDVISVIHKVLKDHWHQGIKAEHDNNKSWEYKFSGYPWWGRGPEYIIPRFVVCKILESLQGKGWTIEATIDVTRGTRDKTILVLAPSNSHDSSQVMCLSFADRDKIRLINAPDNLVDVCREILMKHYCKGIESEKFIQTSCPAHEFMLKENPFFGAGELSLHIRSTLCYIIKEFAALGWRFLMSADVTSSTDDDSPYDVHSWYFVAEPSVFTSMHNMPPSYKEACKS